MKAKILGLLAVGLLAGPMAAQAITFTVQLTRTADASIWNGTFDAPATGGAVTAMSIVIDGLLFGTPHGLFYSPDFLTGDLFAGPLNSPTAGLTFWLFEYVGFVLVHIHWRWRCCVRQSDLTGHLHCEPSRPRTRHARATRSRPRGTRSEPTTQSGLSVRCYHTTAARRATKGEFHEQEISRFSRSWLGGGTRGRSDNQLCGL